MKRASLYEVYNFLPKTDCKQCGMDCMGFAGYLIARDLLPEDCPVLLEADYQASFSTLTALLGRPREKDPLTGFILEPETCNGCGICVIACEACRAEEAKMTAGQVFGPSDRTPLQVMDGCVRLARPDACSRAIDSATLCRACEERCPSDSILLV